MTRLLVRVGCTCSVLKQRDVSVKWLRSWIGPRTDMINRFPNQTFGRLLCRLRLKNLPRNRGGRLRNHLSRRCMNQVAEKGRTRGPDPSSLAIVSGVVHTVVQRVTVERRLLGGQEQPRSRRQSQAGKAETKAAKAAKELCFFEKWLDTDEEAMCRSIGSVSRHEKYS